MSIVLRRLVCVLVAAALSASVVGCGDGADATAATTPPRDLPTLRPVQASVDDLAFDRSGTLFALRGRDVSTVDAQGRLRRVKRFSDDRVGSGSLSPDASSVALFTSIKQEFAIRVVSRSTGRTRWTAPQESSVYDAPRALWSADGARLITESDDPPRVFDAKRGRLLRTLRRTSGYTGRQPFSPDGRSVVLGGGHGVPITSVATGRRRVLPDVDRIDREPSLDRPAWSPDGTLIAGTGAQALDLSTEKFRPLGTIRSGTEVAWSPDGRWLATFGVLEGKGDEDGGVSVLEVATGEEFVLAHGGAREERGELAWSADSRQIAYVSPPGSPCAPESGGGNLC